MGKLKVVPLAGRIGAEIRGVELGPRLDADQIAAIREAWLRHKVVFFRNQKHLDDETQEHLAPIFGGAPMAHPTVPSADGSRFIYEVSSQRGAASMWHTDVTWIDAVPRGSILRALKVPPVGGDTIWASTAAAYGDLPEGLRQFADDRWVLHSNGSEYVSDRVEERRDGTGSGGSFWTDFQSTVFETVHPLVHVHPETGERCLLLGQFVRRIIGTTPRRTAQLYRVLQSFITRPENTDRWRWRAGDVVVWVNRATQHYALADYGDALRTMRRVSIEGQPSVSIDGRRGRTIRRGTPAATVAAQRPRPVRMLRPAGTVRSSRRTSPPDARLT